MPQATLQVGGPAYRLAGGLHRRGPGQAARCRLQRGIRDCIGGVPVSLYGGQEEGLLRGDPGEIVAQRDGAICRATKDGGVWIPQIKLRPPDDGQPGFELPASLALRSLGVLNGVPELRLPFCPVRGYPTYREISYTECDHVGVVKFCFPGGAMSTAQGRRLLSALRFAAVRQTRAIMLVGDTDVFANGVHLNVIEAAADPAEESWSNINAIDDLVEAILVQTRHLVIAAIGGNAAAGGLMMALAADEGLGPGGRRAQPSLQADGPSWQRVLDLYAPWPCRRGGRPAADRELPAGHRQDSMSARTRRRGAGVLNGRVPEPGRRPRRGTGPGRCLRRGKAGSPAGAPDQDENRKPLSVYREAELRIMRKNFAGGPGEPYPGVAAGVRPQGEADRDTSPPHSPPGHSARAVGCFRYQAGREVTECVSVRYGWSRPAPSPARSSKITMAPWAAGGRGT
jgi:putative two-component system protein, hydrogenase maturation factor HypX/HoxX